MFYIGCPHFSGGGCQAKSLDKTLRLQELTGMISQASVIVFNYAEHECRHKSQPFATAQFSSALKRSLMRVKQLKSPPTQLFYLSSNNHKRPCIAAMDAAAKEVSREIGIEYIDIVSTIIHWEENDGSPHDAQHFGAINLYIAARDKKPTTTLNLMHNITEYVMSYFSESVGGENHENTKSLMSRVHSPPPTYVRLRHTWARLPSDANNIGLGNHMFHSHGGMVPCPLPALHKLHGDCSFQRRP